MPAGAASNCVGEMPAAARCSWPPGQPKPVEAAAGHGWDTGAYGDSIIDVLLSRLHHQPGGRGVRRGERGELLERHADALLRVADPGAQADLRSAKLLLG